MYGKFRGAYYYLYMIKLQPEIDSTIGTAGVHDGEHYYMFLFQYVDNVLYVYCPDFRPGVLDADSEPDAYYIIIRECAHPLARIVDKFYFTISDCVACVPFRYENNFYFNVFKHESTSHYLFPVNIAIVPVIDIDDEYVNSRELTGGQCTLRDVNTVSLVCTFDTALRCVLCDKNGTELDTAGVIKYVSDNYGLDNFMISQQITLCDNDNAYCTYTTDTVLISTDSEYEPLSISFSDLNGGIFVSNEQWTGSLRLQGTLTIYRQGDIDEEDETTWAPAVTLRAVPVILTREKFALFITDKTIDKDYLENMIVYQPRIINKTVQEVVNMTSESSDSKAGIIQPVFFRTRDMASLVIHPDVDENICINLDAYKSQVDSFILKIEGVNFNESGRTNAGVVFKVRGNLLPGSSTSGLAYILNEEGELITTGKYTYEY